MRTHLIAVTVAGTGRIPRDAPDARGALDGLVERAAEHTLPLPPESLTAARWRSPDGTVACWSWSNEDGDVPGGAGPLQRPVAGGVLLGTGYLRPGWDGVPAALDRLAGGTDDALDGVGGIWSAALVRPGRVVAASSLAGVEPWYYAESGDGTVWLGTRASLVHLAARGRPEQPATPDLLGLAALVNTGYLLVRRSAYAGVRHAGPGGVLVVDSGLRAWTRSPGDRQGTDVLDGGRRVAEALVDAVTDLAGRDEPVRLGLTGGRDSRLAAAALAAAGVPTTTFTKAFPGNGDLVVAELVAEALGMRHERLDPAVTDGDSVLVDPDERFRSAVVLCDGQLSAFDATGSLGTRWSAGETVLSGASGGVVRAEFAPMSIYPRRGRNGPWWMRNAGLFRNQHLLASDLRDAYAADVAPWIERVDAEPVLAMEDFFLEERTARWGGAARQGNSLAATPRTPFLDDAVLRAVHALTPQVRAEEGVLREALRLLAPVLLDVPYFGRRLRCDAAEPPEDDVEAVRRWRGTEPVVPPGGGGATFRWQVDYGPELAGPLHDRLRVPGIEALLDLQAVEAAAPRSGPPDVLAAETLWNLGTAADLLAGRHHDPADRYRTTTPSVRVPRPGAGAAPGQSVPERRAPRAVTTRLRRWLTR